MATGAYSQEDAPLYMRTRRMQGRRTSHALCCCLRCCLCRTYSTLVSSGKGKKSRLQQVVDWVGGPAFQGCIVLDECESTIKRLAHPLLPVALPACGSWPSPLTVSCE